MPVMLTVDDKEVARGPRTPSCELKLASLCRSCEIRNRCTTDDDITLNPWEVSQKQTKIRVRGGRHGISSSLTDYGLNLVRRVGVARILSNKLPSTHSPKGSFRRLVGVTRFKLYSSNRPIDGTSDHALARGSKYRFGTFPSGGRSKSTTDHTDAMDRSNPEPNIRAIRAIRGSFFKPLIFANGEREVSEHSNSQIISAH